MFSSLQRHHKESPDGDIEVHDGISDSSSTKGGNLLNVSTEAQYDCNQESPRDFIDKNFAKFCFPGLVKEEPKILLESDIK